MKVLQRHYDAMVPDNTDEKQDEIDETVRESMLLGAEFDPTTPINILEALGEANTSFFVSLSKLMRAKNSQGVGLALESMCDEYWKALAEKSAEKAYQAKRN